MSLEQKENAGAMIYPGAVIHFQAFMERFIVLNRGDWESNDGERLDLRYDPSLATDTQSYWHVTT